MSHRIFLMILIIYAENACSQSPLLMNDGLFPVFLAKSLRHPACWKKLHKSTQTRFLFVERLFEFSCVECI